MAPPSGINADEADLPTAQQLDLCTGISRTSSGIGSASLIHIVAVPAPTCASSGIPAGRRPQPCKPRSTPSMLMLPARTMNSIPCAFGTDTVAFPSHSSMRTSSASFWNRRRAASAPSHSCKASPSPGWRTIWVSSPWRNCQSLTKIVQPSLAAGICEVPGGLRK